MILAILGTFLAASGVKLLYSLFATLVVSEDLAVPLVVAGIVLFHMGLKDVIRAFRAATPKPTLPAAKEQNDDSAPA